jgi:voltage-gated sodium channel
MRDIQDPDRRRTVAAAACRMTLRAPSCARMASDGTLKTWCARLVEDARFQAATVVLILLNAALVGLETDSALMFRYHALFGAANVVILSLFMLELALRIGAAGFRIMTFLRDPWNAFDSAVIAVSLIPGIGAFATVARIARVLRIARLVSVSPKLRLIVGTMMRSIPSLGHVTVLLGLLLYMYAIIGVNLFGAHDPHHWATLGSALLTLFQMLTLEGWVEIQAASMAAGSWVWIYYSSFVVLAVFVVVNLFIAVVLNNLDELREEDRRAAAEAVARQQALLDPHGFAEHLTAIRRELDRVEDLYRKAQGDAAQR